jgi:outer membrane protein assembly factor BamB
MMNCWIYFLVFSIAPLFCAVWAGEKSQDAWPVFHGNATQTGVAASSLPEQLEILWQFKAKDSIEGAAAIRDGVAYVASLDENLYALDLSNGKLKWSYKAGPVKASASVDHGLVYVGNVDGMFHCVDAATGQKRWTYETGAEITSGANFTPDAVLFGSGDETLYCLSRDGQLRWKFKVPGGPVLGSPAIVGNRTFAAGCDSTLHVIDVANGKEIGEGVDLGGQVGATVAVVGDMLYVATMSNEVRAIDWKKCQTVWSYQPGKRRQPFYASPAVTDTLVVTGCRDKRVHALARDMGTVVWTFETRDKVDGSPVIVGDRVFIGSMDRNLYVLDLAKGTLLKRFDLGGPITATPAVAQGCLVIGTNEGAIYCLGKKKRTSS